MSFLHFEQYLLDNGLRVIIHEDHTLPKVVMSIAYRVGAKDEEENKTGFAHLFEHLMFGGSKNIPNYDKPLQRVGGQNNAFTNNDLTNYYITLPSSQIETAFWLESDRMLELGFSPKSLEVQQKVVIEEYKQKYLNKPYGDAHILLREIHFKKHPYRWPTIGRDISHIEDATMEDVKDFFFGFYAPNNATLVLAGDITPARALELTHKWFGPIPSRELKKKPLPAEPLQTEARTLSVEREVPFTGVYKMFHIPMRTSPRYPETDVLTDILSFGRGSLLYETLVKDKKIATSANAYSWGMHDPGMISIDAILAPGKTVEEYESVLNELLFKLQSVADEELDRVKSAVETHFVMERTTLLNSALLLGGADVLGDASLVNQLPAIYRELSVAQVRQAAKDFLVPENSSTLFYHPAKS
jgi:zinc protease